MGTLDGIEIFTSTVTAGSFASAARRLGVTPSAVSRRVAQLEEELGVQLLARTTRTLRLTDDGRAFYDRCLRIIEELGEARAAIARSGGKPSGTLRVDAPVALGRKRIASELPRFLDRYPDIRLDITFRDQLVDPIAEGLDLVIRIGALADSTLVARRLGESRIVHCASPPYLRKRGMPKTPRDLQKHACIGYLSEGRPLSFRFVTDEDIAVVDIQGPCNANDVDLMLTMALAGKGIAGIFDFVAHEHLERGTLVEVLADHPGAVWPIHALYPKNRHLLPKVSAFLDFVASVLRAPESTVSRGTSRRGRR
ncbi:Transcriptional regulator, LysR family [Labilithrix luteola]|uniref:Transcriptional regulator, LysR family n=1 Tax=Labilithrix luteola TaxID=1391654 RepID=A0A0K1PM01_9BACT|nr:LysR family transcriptional regulator [Labilithrix luteola]AKU94421.1 Transcriptional regulator, LysR family [Labilithrix luteola]